MFFFFLGEKKIGNYISGDNSSPFPEGKEEKSLHLPASFILWKYVHAVNLKYLLISLYLFKSDINTRCISRHLKYLHSPCLFISTYAGGYRVSSPPTACLGDICHLTFVAGGTFCSFYIIWCSFQCTGWSCCASSRPWQPRQVGECGVGSAMSLPWPLRAISCVPPVRGCGVPLWSSWGSPTSCTNNAGPAAFPPVPEPLNNHPEHLNS